MATPMTSSNTIEFDSVKRYMHARALELDDYQQLKLTLSSLLQSSLDLQDILRMFRDELEQVIEMQGLIYINDSRQLHVEVGKKATHSCGYRLITEHDYLGEISFYRSERFSEFDLELLEGVLGALVYPLRNALRYRDAVVASLTDPLTGAGNRIALDNALLREMELAKRHHSPLALLLVDVDDFKLINDNQGHKTGDLVLKSIVKLLAEVNRQTDLSFRYGGEEFVVLLNDTDMEGAMVIAQRIRQAIEEFVFDPGEEQLRVTVSIGATAMKRADNKDAMFLRADKALYVAKDAGKNQVVAL